MTDTTGKTNGLSPLKRAYLKLDELQSKLDVSEGRHQEPIAIVGMGCRFPGGADGPAAYWRLLRNGVDAVGEIPAGRWDVDEYYDPSSDSPGKMYTRAGGFLEQVDGFDPQLFGISPREAMGLDPQQRLLLEVAWEAFENAGQAPDKLMNSRTGVFVGVVSNDYSQLQVRLGDMDLFDAHHASGIAHSMASGRLSYVFGLMGPSMSIDTACSSSLAAVHLACQSLSARECNTALAGGVNLILSPVNNIAFCQSAMLSRSGRSMTFAAGADGFVHSEGCGLVVLKRLSDALEDGDRIEAVIRGSSINQDGPSSGITAPNGPAQESVIRTALKRAGVAPSQVSYVEAHGTATPLGDPIEAQALGAVLGEQRSVDRPLLIGAVKTNIGHLSAAAGVAGLIKVVLALKARQIPPNLHFDDPSPHIPWSRLPLEVVTSLRPWETDGDQLIAGVSSFGFSGTNVHLVVGDAPEPEMDSTAIPLPPQLFTLSARSEPALRSLTQSYAEVMASDPSARLLDIASTANAGRAHFKHRLVTVGETPAQVSDALSAFLDAEGTGDVRLGHLDSPEPPRIAFLFTGQGSQYVGMGRQLFDKQPRFRRTLERCDALLKPHIDRSLLEILFDESAAGGARLIDQTGYTQPALFAIEYALADLWRSWGVEPWVVMGHSVGEYVAACIAGIIDLEQALGLIAKRGRLMQSLPEGGRMAAVFADAEKVSNAIADHASTVSIAAINGPESVVISGSGHAVEAVLRRLATEGIAAEPLAVSHAFHSPLMEPILDELEAATSEMNFGPPRIGMVSNLTGEPVGAGDLADGSYWRRHAREAVQFEASIRGLYDRGIRVFLEIGPHPVLIGMARNCLPQEDAAWLPSLRRGQDDWVAMQRSLGELYLRGTNVDWAGYASEYHYKKLALPTYPYERSPYWIKDARWDHGVGAGRSSRRGRIHPLLGRRIDTALEPTIYETEVDPDCETWVYEHVVHDLVVFPAAAVLEMASAASRDFFQTQAATVSEVTLGKALVLPADEVRRLQLVVSPSDGGDTGFRLFASEAEGVGNKWNAYFAGVISPTVDADGVGSSNLLEETASLCDEEIDVQAFYRGLRDRGLQFGQSFEGIARLQRCDGEALGEIRLPAAEELQAEGYQFHPVTLDACIQVVAAAVPGFAPEDRGSDIFMPVAIDKYLVHGGTGAPRFSHARVERSDSGNSETFTCQLGIYDEEKRLVAQLLGLHLKRADSLTLASHPPEGVTDWIYGVDWQPQVPVGKGDRRKAPGAIAERLETRLVERGKEHGAAVYESLDRDIDALCAAYIVAAFESLGWEFEPGRGESADSMLESLGILERHRQLLQRFLEILGEEGILCRTGEEWVVQERPSLGNPEELYAHLVNKYAECSAELRWTHRCGQKLAQALRGDVDPQELLFPSGDLELATEVYGRTPLARALNVLAGDALREWLADLPTDQPVRVLEIGAGTGGTTAHVLDRLPADRTEYIFTDIGPAFVRQARERFADSYPFVRYATLDIEQNPLDQGFAVHEADVIIAANVLHATSDLHRTMRHVCKLLAPGGLLLLLEVTKQQRWFDVTVGLTEGWWAFKDKDLRPSHALLDRTRWQNLLAEHELTESVAVPATAEGASVFRDKPMILARAPAVAEEESGNWLIFADEGGLGRALSQRLAERGADCMLVQKGENYELQGDQVATVDPGRPEHFSRLISDRLSSDRSGPSWVVYLWGLDSGLANAEGAQVLPGMEIELCGGVLHLVQALLSSSSAGSQPRLRIATRGAQSVASYGKPIAPGQATLWGLGKSLVLEHPELQTLLLDLDPQQAASASEADALLDEIQFRSAGSEVALRANATFAARLRRVGLRDGSAPGSLSEPARLQVPTSGLLADLELAPLEREAPGPGEVEIRITAAGLNFRDVLTALGMRPDFDQLGTECAGRICRVGEGVTGLEVGDEVLAIAPGSIATHAVADAQLVVKKPVDLSFGEAVTLPIAFLTADFALTTVGGMKAGDSVLIHAAAGGVGMAAVQLAKRAGAEIYATAGSPEKRRVLEELGIEHVMSSRTLEFADEILQATNGRGVDLVLNSLAGEFVDKGLSVLAPGGRFLELGKSDVRSAAEVKAINDSAEYFAVDLTDDMETRPDTLAPLMARLIDDVVRGDLKPLPKHAFSLTESAAAFRFMEQARHIGKIVLLDEEPQSSLTDSTPIRFEKDGTYLVTGGLGGLGLLVAGWLVDRGARNLVLVGRSGASEAAAKEVDRLHSLGARIQVASIDISHEDEVRSLLSSLRGVWPPLRGVFHSAGVLDDGTLAQQEWVRFEKVLAPKVAGAWLLHTLTEDMPLDHFVLFSSVASLLGSAGQSNHAAANAFLDSLAQFRRSRGLCGLSINWGIWSEIGAGARHGVDKDVAGRGLDVMSPDLGLRALELAMRGNAAQVGVTPVKWPIFLHGIRANEQAPFFSEMVQESRRDVAISAPAPIVAKSSESDILERLKNALPNKRRPLLLNHVQECAMQILGLPTSATFDRQQPLSEMGMDSLMAVELRNLLRGSLDQSLPATLVFDYPSTQALADFLAESHFESQELVPPDADHVEGVADLLSMIENISDDDADRLLGENRGYRN